MSAASLSYGLQRCTAGLTGSTRKLRQHMTTCTAGQRPHIQGFSALLHAPFARQHSAGVGVLLARLPLAPEFALAPSQLAEEGLQVVAVVVGAAEDEALVHPASHQALGTMHAFVLKRHRPLRLLVCPAWHQTCTNPSICAGETSSTGAVCKEGVRELTSPIEQDLHQAAAGLAHLPGEQTCWAAPMRECQGRAATQDRAQIKESGHR